MLYRHFLEVCKLVWELSTVLCPVDVNEYKTLGLSCTWLEYGTVGTAVQYSNDCIH